MTQGRRLSRGGVIIPPTATAAPFDPLTMDGNISVWDMEGSITVVASDVTQIDDAVGSNHLQGGNNPAYDSAYASFGNSKAAIFDSTNFEMMSTFITASVPFTAWAIIRLTSISIYNDLYGLQYDAAPWSYLIGTSPSPSQRWSMEDTDLGAKVTATITLPNASWAQLVVCRVNGNSTTFEINGAAQAETVSGTMPTTSVTELYLGYDPSFEDYADMAFTIGGIVSGSMPAQQSADLYTWAQENRGVPS